MKVRNGWTGALGRGVAILALLGAAACQQAADDGGSRGGGMFGMGGKEDNRSRDSNRSANAQGPAPAPTPGPTTPTGPQNPFGTPGTPVPTVTPGPTAPTADGRDRRVRINNQSGQTVTLVKGSPVSHNEWGRDRIPTTTLGNGQSIIVDFNDNNGECSYDLQATLQDGTERAQAGVNICQITDWTITPTGTQAR